MIKIQITIILCIVLIDISSCYSQKMISIDEAVKTAMESNPQIRIARLNIKKEEAVKLKLFNIPKPQVFVEYEEIKGSLNNFGMRKIGISQELEFPSTYFLRTDVQLSQIKIAEQELYKLSNELKAEVKSGYFKLFLNIKLHEIAKEKFKLYDEFLFVAQKKYEAGSGTHLEVLGAKVNKIKTENVIKNIESDARSIQSGLRKLMNISYDIIPTGDLEFEEMVLTKQTLFTKAIANNPDFKIAHYQKEKFSNKVSLSKSELLPSFSFSYFNQRIGDDGGFWGVELALGIPLWFWWEQTGNIKESGYEFQISQNDEYNIKNSIANEINQLFLIYENNLRQLQFFRNEAMLETDEIFRQAKRSYEEGEIGYVEYLQTLGMLYDTKTEYLNAIYNYNESIINLEKITAGEIK